MCCPGLGALEWGAAFAGEAKRPCRVCPGACLSCLTLGATLPSPSISSSVTTLERTE